MKVVNAGNKSITEKRIVVFKTQGTSPFVFGASNVNIKRTVPFMFASNVNIKRTVPFMFSDTRYVPFCLKSIVEKRIVEL